MFFFFFTFLKPLNRSVVKHFPETQTVGQHQDHGFDYQRTEHV